MKDIIRICNLMIRFSKFTSNKKIKKKFEGFFFQTSLDNREGWKDEE